MAVSESSPSGEVMKRDTRTPVPFSRVLAMCLKREPARSTTLGGGGLRRVSAGHDNGSANGSRSSANQALAGFSP
jgi:hypothetical protein